MSNRPTGRSRARLLNGASMVLAGAALCFAPSAFAQDAADEEIVVTGTRLQGNGYSAPTPVSVIGAEDITLSGTNNIESLLGASPQFVASINGGATANTVPGGNANVNLRGFGPQRNLVLVNGRRFAIQGPDQTTDLNTIPSALIERTEIVTGGSSAVYGSDAIAGVVNFIIRDDFEGVEVGYQRSWDSPTQTPTDDFNLTVGGDFANGRGNVAISVNYLNRGSITRGERGDWAVDSLSDGCVTAASWSDSRAGTPLAVPGGQTCRTAGGIPGLIAGGSGDIPNNRISGLPLPGSAQSNPALNAAYAAAGLGSMGNFGVTFGNDGAQRIALDPQDRYNLGPDNYLQIPQERWMLNAFSTYDFAENIEGYLEFHFSNNSVSHQLAPTNVGGNFLIDVDNPYVTPEMQDVFEQLDARETGPANVVTGTSTRVNNPNDGFALVTLGRRLVENGKRFNTSERVAWRTAIGLRGDLGSVSDGFLRDLSYDAYYTYAQTDQTDLQSGNASRSRFATAILQNGTADPVCNIFGANMSPACISAIGINATNYTTTEMQTAGISVAGALFDLPAGPVDFALGYEWRYAQSSYRPDTFLSSGDVVGFNPGLPTNGDQTVREIFGEVRVPLVEGVPFLERLALNGAFRYSDYDLEGVGGVWTYSEGIDWAPIEDLTIRANFQHAIRAPNIGELFGGNATNFNNAVDPCGPLQPAAGQTQAVRDLCIASGVPSANVFTSAVQSPTGSLIGNVSGGNPNVGAEESDTLTIGAVYQPGFLPGFAASIDYFKIELDGAIGQLGGGLANTMNLCYNIIQDASSEFCQAIQRNPNTGEITPPYAVYITNANTGGIETSGVDMAANYAHDLGWGLFENSSTVRVDTAWTWTEEFTSTPVQAFPNITNQCLGAFGQTCGEPIPEWKGVTRLTLDTGPLSLSLRHRYIGESTDDRYVLPTSRGVVVDINNITNPVIEAYHYFDLSGSWDATEDLRIYGGVNNVMDEDPPILGSAQVRANTWTGTYDTNGRFFFVGATVKFN